MREFLAKYEAQYEKRINDDMFRRKFNRPLVEYIIDTCKNLEVIPAIKLDSYEYITDQTKIRISINKDFSKDPKIKNNKQLERLVQKNRSLNDLLILHFTVSANGRTEHITRRMLVLKELPGGYFIRAGKKVLPLIQVVDNSTFVKDNVLKFKTTLYPIELYTIRNKLVFTDGTKCEFPMFRLGLFMKVCNPLLYHLANYGMQDTIELFSLNDVISVVAKEIDPENYLYLKVNKKVFIEVNRKIFTKQEFIMKFVGTLYDALVVDAKTITMKDIYDKDYWLGRLSEAFSKKRNVDKGRRVLISFTKVLDPTAKKRLSLKKYHTRNTYMVVRWMMTNFPELLKKDNNDLKNKRVRSTECIAYFFDNYVTRNVYSVLNTDNPKFEKYIQLLNTINEYTLLKNAQGGGKVTLSSMLRYERYNDFDAIELSRYTLKGPTGLNGGKKATSMQYRDIYPSQMGRYDLNTCSSTDPGLTGFLTANVKLNKHGYFVDGDTEPDVYDTKIFKLVDKCKEDGYLESRKKHIALECSRDEKGFITLEKRRTTKDYFIECNKDPFKHGMYKTADGMLHLRQRMPRDKLGFIVLTDTSEKTSANEYKRDENGFIVLDEVDPKVKKRKSRK